MKSKGQVTIFIIIAIMILVGVGVYLLVKGGINVDEIPKSIAPVYNTFLFCLEENTLVGIDVLESQAGYINMPEFDPGSAYMPFSSQLNFLGNPVPYWYYVSGNNIQKEQVPTENFMESELEGFIEDSIRECYFDTYYEQGYEVFMGEPKAKVEIQENGVDVSLGMDLDINFGEDSSRIANHHLVVKSKLGSLYASALEIYEKEQDELFLENYAVGVLRFYAPVDGVELSCAPLVWGADEVFDDLEEAIEANTLALKVKNGDYSLKEEENKYFVINVDVDQNVQFLNSRNWPNGFEVSPVEGNSLVAKPIGNQGGLGIIGFCYAPYHFVYNMRYPVLIQVFEGDEIFQFPMAVVVQGNMPREAMEGSAIETGLPELCSYQNTLIGVNTYDTNLDPVDADISFECIGTKCYIGKTELGYLEEEFPQCANGYISASANGFEDARYLYSTTQEGSVDIILDRLYELEVELKLDGKDYEKDAVISFISDASSKTVFYPQQTSVNLSEGQYEVQVYIYRNSSLKISSTTTEQCVEVPSGGLGSLFGLTKEECFDIETPEQIVSNALSGGGVENYYALESELESSNTIEINAKSLPLPASLEQLQDNYILFEDNDLDIVFK